MAVILVRLVASARSMIAPAWRRWCSRSKARSSSAASSRAAMSGSAPSSARKLALAAADAPRAARCAAPARRPPGAPCPLRTSASITASLKNSPPVQLQVLRACASALTTRPSTRPAARADHEVGEAGRVGADHALDRRVRDVALVPQRDVLQRRPARTSAAGARARTGSRTGSGSSCAASPSEPFCPLPNASSPRRPRCAASGARRARCARSRCRGAPAPRSRRRGDRARRSASARSRGEPERAERRALDRRVEVGVGADRAGDLADRDLVARRDERARARARARRSQPREHQAGGDRLGVDAVRAADHRRRARAPRRGGGRPRAAGRCRPGSASARLDQLDRERGVEHVGRRHPEVQPARRLARELLDVGQERDHVVPRALLVLEDARRDRACPPPWPARRPRCRPGPCRPPPSPRRRRARPAARSRSGGGRTTARPARGACSGRSSAGARSNEIAPPVQGRSTRGPERLPPLQSAVRCGRVAQRVGLADRRSSPRPRPTTSNSAPADCDQLVARGDVVVHDRAGQEQRAPRGQMRSARAAGRRPTTARTAPASRAGAGSRARPRTSPCRPSRKRT